MTDTGRAVVNMPGVPQPEAIVIGADRPPQVPDGRGLAAGRDHLLLVHAVAHQLATATKSQRRVGGEQQYRGQ